MSEQNLDASQLVANLRDAMRLSAQANEIAAQMRDVTGTARSSNDTIEVTVDHQSFMTGLRFSHGATANGVDKLGQQVLATLSLAAADLQAKGAPLRAQLTIDPDELLARIDHDKTLERLTYTKPESISPDHQNGRS